MTTFASRMRIGKEEINAVLEVLNRDPVCLSGYYKNPRGGPSLQAFENALAEYLGTKYALCVSNGTTALHLALLAWGRIHKGFKSSSAVPEIITTPITFSATATSVLMVDACPVFVDVDPKTYNIDPECVKESITPRTRAIIPVHLLGMPADLDPLKEIADDHDLLLLEDNAQCLGGKYKGMYTGTTGQLSTVSFQETKVITSGGEGGAIFTDDDLLAEKIRLLRNHGQQYGLAPFNCFNFRMTEIQAAIGLAQLGKLDYFNSLQVENAKRLFEKLPKEIHPPHIPDYAEPMLYLIGCTTEPEFPREDFVKRLTDKGVNKNLPGATIGLGYTKTIMDLPLLQRYKRFCPNAEELVMKFLWFDCHRFRSPDYFSLTDLADIKETLEEMGY